MAEENNEVSSQYFKLPDSFKIQPGHAVCSRQAGTLEISEDAESFFKSYASEWSKISPYDTSNPGSMMSELVDGIVGKGISLSCIRSRCVHVNIQKSKNFGILNSLVSPYGAEAVPPNSMNRPTTFVFLINHGSISRNLDKFVDLFVKLLNEEVIRLHFYLSFVFVLIYKNKNKHLILFFFYEFLL